MTEQEKRPLSEQLVEGANNTKKLAGAVIRILYETPDFINKSGASAYLHNPWVGFEKNDANFLVRFEVKETELGPIKILRIDRKGKDSELVQSAQLVYRDSDHEKTFEGLSFIEGLEKAEMVHQEEGAYRSDYKDEPLLGVNAERKSKDLIKSLI